MSLLFVALLAALLFAYLAIPLLFPRQADPLPDLRDPVVQDLEEERDALLRAIRELDARTDLPEARREALRGRYEAKAAKVLRALDERQGEVAPARPPTRSRRLPLGALTLLAGVLVGGTLLASSLPPEIRSADGGAPAITGRELQRLERAAARTPNEANLLALADGYWRADNGDDAEATYLRVTQEVSPVPAVAYQRLGFLRLQVNLAEAVGYLELARSADPQNLETLYFLGEVHYASRNMAAAAEAWEAYLAAPGGEGDAEVAARLRLATTLAPLIEAVEADPSEVNLGALADAYWANAERDRAVDLYFQLLTEANPHNTTALSRVGQQLFFGGRNEDAVAVLGRARELSPDDLPTLLFLGNAHFSLGDYEAAINVWQDYVRAAGGAERAGRVPSLIADAEGRLERGDPPPTQEALQEVLPAEVAEAALEAAPAPGTTSSAVPEDTPAHPAPETDAPETDAPETDALETEGSAARPEASRPETSVPNTTVPNTSSPDTTTVAPGAPPGTP